MASIVGAKGVRISKAKRARKRRRRMMGCYESRGVNLSHLGYESYADYLEGPEWRRIRSNKMQRHPRCLACAAPSEVVHHLSYSQEVLLGMEPWELVALCHNCHRRIEFDGDAKRDLVGANDALFTILRDSGRAEWVDSYHANRATGKRLRALARRKRRQAERSKPKKQKRQKVVVLCPGCGKHRRAEKLLADGRCRICHNSSQRASVAHPAPRKPTTKAKVQ